MISIESSDVLHMRDSSFSELLDEINAKARQARMSVLFAVAALIVAGLVALATGGSGLFLCILALPAWAIGKWLDSYRRTTVLYYDLEGDAETAYCRLVGGFDGLIECAAKWHIEAGGSIQSLTAWKRNAGASHLVDRKSTSLTYELPAIINSNITPPALHVGRQVMFFFPDIVFIQSGNRVGAVHYADLNVRWQDSRFIESENVPRDAQIVGYNWQHPNKNGGPDMRFKYNKQIPVCLYESMYLSSDSGVSELLEFSRTGVVAPFVAGCRMLAALPRQRGAVAALPPVSENNPSVSTLIGEVEEEPGPSKTASLVVTAILMGMAVIYVIRTYSSNNSDIKPNNYSVNDVSKGADAKIDASVRGKGGSENLPQVKAVTKSDVVPSGQGAKGGVEQITTRYAKTAVNLREGPGSTFNVITVVQKGTKLIVIEAGGDWSRVRINEKTSGWMANSMMSDK
ncbi:SH3 domain-containing protein [Xanthobacter autotrophicus]|uniref:SH3 domain-containing protein n=1 Tax=Xanthobacter autotrophicus TaxID=280 RepID=UPI001E477061|nr:SH3 domain-containing protein [Xanthobacter autotrophicus]UDQ91819.1 SH3 domain-containing protein [Xanthobacter autotrophicus]